MSFTLHASRSLPALDLRVEEWVHGSGLRHVHLACDDAHRAFAIAFRTPPTDSTGLPHILEHTALCGSARYPVRDPFFHMLRRSLQTFMNAMTFPELTAYPFASQVEKDWFNLLDVYLDAVFAPRLRALDFAQEGHRLTPDAKSASGWKRAGVVFNEMKGALDATSSRVERAVAAALLPDTPYAHEYGGDPVDIPSLAHADLVAFHRRCYVPANAVAITYGRVDPLHVHQRLLPYLVHAGVAVPPPSPQPPLPAAQSIDVPVPWGETADVRDATSAGVHFAFGDTADLDEILTCELLDRVLTGHAGAPLRLALEESRLGRSTGGTGYHGHYRTGLFSAELDGVDPADYPRVHELIDATLHRIARDGVRASELEAALHQTELTRREISGDSYPYGLELCFRVLNPWNYGRDCAPALDQSAALARLRQRALAPGFVTSELTQRFLNNPHRVAWQARPDRHLHARAEAAEAAGVARAIAALDDARIAALRREADALTAHQAERDDPKVLPDLDASDIPARRDWAKPLPGLALSHAAATGTPITFGARTNGLRHHLRSLALPALTADELDLLPLLVHAYGGLGVGAESYTDFSARLNACCGGLQAWTDLSADATDPARIHAFLHVEVKGLASRAESFSGLPDAVLDATIFSEHDRIAELLDADLQSLQDRVQRSGNSLAARAAQRGLPGAAGLGHRLAGLGRLAWLKRTAAACAAPDALAALAEGLRALAAKIAAVPRLTARVIDTVEVAALRMPVLPAHHAPWAPTPFAVHGLAAETAGASAFTTATPVSYVALAFAGPGLAHADAPLLSVACRLVTHAELHPRIRERGGAYGASASWAGGSASCVLTSYRDPRLSGTLDDMRAGLTWLAACPEDPRLIKEAVLGVLSSLDSPASPAGEAKSRHIGDLRGATTDLLDAFRAGVLAATPAAIRRVAATWLPAHGGQPAAVTSHEALAGSGLGWTETAI